MVSQQSLDVAHKGRELYEQKHRADLEANHMNRFVAIEPVSGEYFLGDTLSAAIQNARTAHPNRLSYALRIGPDSAIHMGLLWKA